MTTNVLRLIPEEVAKFIAQSNRWTDGDTWIIGNGLVIEYEVETNLFFVHNRRTKTTLGSVPFRAVMEKGHLAAAQSNHRDPEEVYEQGVQLVNGKESES